YHGNSPPIANAGGPYTVAEGGSVMLSGAASSDPDGDPLTYAWDLDNNGSFETAGISPTFSAAGLNGPTSRTVRLQVTDSHGATSAVATATVNVTNAAPVIQSVTNSGPIAEGGSATISVVATDPGGDSLTYT